MRHVTPITLALAAAICGAAATAEDGPAVHDVANARIEGVAAAMDIDRDGAISASEAAETGRQVFASLDADGSGAVDRAEMLDWEHGMSALAAFRGREQAYEAALGFAFDLFDADGDGTVTRAEHEAGIARSTAFADMDGDGGMSRGEFLRRFVYSVAMRAALEGRE